MKTLSIDLPETVDRNTEELKIIIAGKLYEQGILSLGQGAKLAGLSKKAFIEVIGKYNVSLFNYSPEALKKDFQNA